MCVCLCVFVHACVCVCRYVRASVRPWKQACDNASMVQLHRLGRPRLRYVLQKLYRKQVHKRGILQGGTKSVHMHLRARIHG